MLIVLIMLMDIVSMFAYIKTGFTPNFPEIGWMPNQKINQHIHLLVTADELASIDVWRFSEGIGPRNEAIRRLIALGLRAAAGQREPEPPAPRRAPAASR